MLGTHPSVIGLGEVHRISLETEHRICSCGKRVLDCDFWGDNINVDLSGSGYVFKWVEGNGVPDVSVPRRKRRKRNSFLSPITNLLAVVGNKSIFRLWTFINDWAYLNLKAVRNSFELFRKIGFRHEAKVIVDSTKSPLRGKIMQMFYPEFI
jgi:hypothetical protein